MKTKHKLKGKRVELNLTQKQIAKQIGVSEQHFQKWESGNTEPRISYAIAWANMLGIDMNEFVERYI